ncbi:MAG TPA: HAD-IC family P-type ATPase [Acidimicrobiales bacterium]|nr:HAD-IC family P-type ATPase [Acidimicrobiales bacterium]
MEPDVDIETGLTEAEVAARRERGEVNDVPEAPSRKVSDIIRANVFTRFNAILGVLFAVIVIVGPIQDALFGFVLVANTAIGIFQELRAKKTLDNLAVLTTPRTKVLRAGKLEELTVDRIVLDDILELSPGEQIPVDGVVVGGEVEVDESLLTGESDPVIRGPGGEVLSGSFVVAGTARYRATRVGREAYARALAEEAKRFTLVRSELRDGINVILRIVTWAILPTAALLVFSQLRSTDLPDAVRSSVAGIGSMVPEGLVLLTSIAFAVAVIRLGRQKVVVQELAAVEGLARVDVICLDKTGTLTEGVAVIEVQVIAEEMPVADAIGALAAADPSPNATLQAIAASFPAPDGWIRDASVPFSSARKWGAVSFDGNGTWFLGAPDVLLRGDSGAAVKERIDPLISAGRRVVLMARAAEGTWPDPAQLPSTLKPAGLIVLAEQVREDAAATLAYFAAQNVAVKIISGDNHRTVGAIAARLDVPGADQAVDARELPDDPEALADAMDTGVVFGRVAPQQKRAMVRALQSRGHTVAMTGDGVNDVLALKEADMGVAMGSGTDAAKGVANLVLLDDNFDAMPGVVAEGRRVIANVERVANLFLTKTVYAFLLDITVGVAHLPFPFLPRHLTIVSSLTIGIPAFFLALAPNPRRYKPGFVKRVLRFALPAGFAAAAATFAAYAIARNTSGVSLTEARTAATLALFGVGLWVLTILARPMTGRRSLLEMAMVAGLGCILVFPPLRNFYGLELPPAEVLVAIVAIVAIAGGAMELGRKLFTWAPDAVRAGDPD